MPIRYRRPSPSLAYRNFRDSSGAVFGRDGGSDGALARGHAGKNVHADADKGLLFAADTLMPGEVMGGVFGSGSIAD